MLENYDLMCAIFAEMSAFLPVTHGVRKVRPEVLHLSGMKKKDNVGVFFTVISVRIIGRNESHFLRNLKIVGDSDVRAVLQHVRFCFLKHFLLTGKCDCHCNYHKAFPKFTY